MPICSTTDMRNLPVEERVLGPILRMRAEREGDRPYLTVRGRTYSFAETEALTRSVARGHHARGIAEGDRVALMLPNCAEFVFTWYACCLIGAALVPINTDYRGHLLDAVLSDSGAKALIVDQALLAPALGSIAAPVRAQLGLVAIVGSSPVSGGHVAFRDLLEDSGPDPEIPGDFQRIQSLSYTSGTTGSSKGVPLVNSHAFSPACTFLKVTDLEQSDTLYSPLPLFHGVASRLGVLPALMVGAHAVLGDRFSASRYWKEATECGATAAHVIHTIPQVLLSQPPSPFDRAHKVRRIYIGHYDPAFEERFNTHLLQAYGLTETGVVMYMPVVGRRPGSVGKAHEDWQAQIVDEEDVPVAHGTPGEIVLRPLRPHIMMQGYLNKADETVRTWRNLWFHTGDIGKQDEDGYFYFVDRKKERIRRRGENVSSTDVESGVAAHPSILECVALPHPAPGGEDDIRIVAVLHEGATLSAVELMDWLQDRLPRFMLPSYIEFVDALPRTPSNKIEKYRLVQQGLGASAWGREEAGYVLRERPERRSSTP